MANPADSEVAQNRRDWTHYFNRLLGSNIEDEYINLSLPLISRGINAAKTYSIHMLKHSLTAAISDSASAFNVYVILLTFADSVGAFNKKIRVRVFTIKHDHDHDTMNRACLSLSTVRSTFGLNWVIQSEEYSAHGESECIFWGVGGFRCRACTMYPFF